MDYNKPTQDSGNWTSAASSAGFGTPTYQNSEQMSVQHIKGEVNIEPRIFSPDHDGYQDFTYINYNLPMPGYTANITIFDAAGRPVRYLVKNNTLTASGNFRWDGLDDRQHSLSSGIYIVLTELFSLTGEIRKFKNSVILTNMKR
jgi:hypothetical protein